MSTGLKLDSTPKNSTLKNIPTFRSEVKKTTDESITEQKELSNEKLVEMNNNDFLKINSKNRLKYITKEKIKSENLIEGSSINFTFTFNGKYNKELYLKTTAGQVFENNINTLKVGNIKYTRNGLSGEFFTAGNRRLIIGEGTQIEVVKIRNKKEIEKIEKENNIKIKLFKETSNYTFGDDDIISEAIKRRIDPHFALLAFSERVKGISMMSIKRVVLIEEMFTEFDRVRGGTTFLGGRVSLYSKVPDGLAIKILKEFGGKDWKIQADKYGISKKEVNRIENMKTAKYLNLTERLNIINRAPEYVKKLVKKYFPDGEYENALLTCNGESSYNKNAINTNHDKYSSTDRGLFQINDHWHSDKYRGENIFNPEVNVRVAAEVFKKAGNSWRPWYAARKIGLA